MEKLNTAFLTREDLRREDKEMPIENISFYNFKVERNVFTESDLVIFYDNMTNFSKVIKYRYTNKFL